MIEQPAFEPLSAAEQPDPELDLDDENGIAAQAVRQGAGDADPDAPLPDDGSGEPLGTEELLSAEDDDDLEDEADEDGDAANGYLDDQDDDYPSNKD